MRILNFVKIHSILKDLFIKEKWLLFCASLCIVIVVVVVVVLPSVLGVIRVSTVLACEYWFIVGCGNEVAVTSVLNRRQFSSLCLYCMYGILPSVLRRCWLGYRKGIRPVKNLSGGCWHGYLSRARCRLAYVPADATAVPKPYHLLPHLHPDWFYYSGTSLPRLSR